MITTDELLAIGFEKDTEEFSPFPIGKELNINTCSPDSATIAITTIRNASEFVFMPGDGSMIFLNIQSISDLLRFIEFISEIDSI